MKLNKITKAIASVGLSVANLVTINAWAAQQTVNFSAGSGSGFQSLKDGENSVNDVTGFSLIFDAGTAPDYISINDWQYFTGTAAYSTSLTSVNGGGTSVGMMLYEENGDAFSLESFTFLRQTSTDDGNYSITLKGYLDGDLKITRNVVIPNASSNTSFTMTRASDFNDDLFKNIDKVTLDFPVINSGSDYDPRHAIINIVIDNAVATDSTAPILSQVTPVTTPTNDNTPNYTFSTDEAGTLSMGGNCGTSTSTTISGTGNQTIILTQTDNSSALADGTYSNCTVTVTDAAGNSSDALAITSFTVDTTAPAVAEVTAVTTPTNDTTPSYTFSTTETGAFTVGGSCGTSTSTTISSTGNQPITLTDTDNSSVLAAGTYSNCTITVTDDAGNSNTPLTITSFIIDTTNPTFDGASSTPNDNATDVSVSNNIVIDFSENIALGSNVITIRDVTGSSNFAVFNVATDSDGATTTPNAGRIGIVNDKIYLNPTSDLTGNRNYAIRIHEDAVNDNAGNSFTEIGDDTTFNFTTANTTPDVDLNSGTGGNDNSVSFSEGSGALNIAPSATVTEADGDTITTITVSLTNDQDGNVEGLNVTAAAQNALSGISGASDITLQDTITVTGATASAAEVQTFLQNISYNNTSSSPNETARTVTVVINDGTANSTSRTATVSVSNVTSANSTAAGFNTTNGTNLSPAITFTDDNETLVITNANHATGSTADGGNGTDTLFAVDSVDLTGLTSLTNFETLTPDNDGALTLSESQHESFSTINGTGDNQFTIASANGDQSLTGDADIETYVLGTAMSFTLASGSQNVTGSTGNDTVNVAALTATGTLNGGTGTNTLQASSGANISGATLSAFSSLTLASGASVTMTEAQHDIFSTITAPGTETITISSSTDGLTGGSAVESYILSSANTFTLGAAGQNLTGSTGNDTVNVGALAATGTLAGGNGTDTLSVGNTGSIAGATLSGFENLSVASGGTASVAASQLSSFSGTISGSGTETLTISGDGNFSTVSAIENYTLSDDSTNARTVTISAAGHSVTGSVSSDAVTFDIGTLTYTGTITGENTVADTLSMGNGANITGATVSNVTNLTLASGATVNMTASQHGDFTGTITAPGSESINITGDGNITTLTGIESYNIGDDSTNTRTINISSSTTSVSATSGSDAITFSVGSNTYTGSLSGEPSVADVVSASDGADVTGGGFFNIGSLTLTSGATVAIDSVNVSNFSNAITGSGGTEVLKLMDGGTFNFANTTVSSVEGIALGTDSIFNITLTDNFNANGQSVSVTNTTGSAISTDQTINASAFASDVLVISATNFNGSDTFIGGSGADTIRPGGGTDSMTGNGGNDNFIGSTSDLSGDTIADLSIGDMITLTGVTGLSTNNVRFNGSSTLEVDTDATDFNISELTLSLTNAPGNDLAFTVADSGSDTVITFISANSAPVFSALNGGATFIENGTAVVLDSDVTIADTELDALNGSAGNYNNASLTINRSGGASSKDVFGNSGLLGVLTEGELFTYNGNSVGTVTTNSAGTLVLTFNSNASSAVVDAVLQTLTYANNSDDPSSSVSLNYTFSDGILNSTGTNQATVTITQLDDAPTDISLSATTINQSVTASGADVATISSTDLDDTSHTYTLVAPNTSTSGSCSSNTGNSSFQINGSILETQSAISSGTYIVCVQSDDSTSTFQESFSITVTDDVAPNAPTSLDLIASSDSGSLNTDNYTNDTTPTLSGLAEVGASITLLSDQTGNAVIGTGTATDGTWEITTSELTANVVHTITAKATDALSNVSVASTGIAITLDTVVPSTPSIPDLDTASDTGTSNTDNITTDTTPTLNGTATVGDVITLTSNVDGVLGTVTVPAGGIWSFTPSSAISAGSHTITAYASDLAGNNSTLSALLSITIDAGASTPTITTPIEGDGKVNASEDNDVVISGSGAEAGASVRVSVDGVIGTVTADGSGNWTLAGGNELDISSLNNGTLSINVTQTDTAGNTSSAATSSIILDNQIPSAVAITTPIEIDNKVNAAEDNDVLVQGSGAESSATVTVNIGGITKTATADASGNWSLAGNELDISSLNNGSLSVSATQSDSAGNTSTAATTSITLDNETPNTLTITTPISTDGKVSAAEDDALLITGAGAESGATVTVNVGGVSTTTTADSSGNWSLSGNELDISALNNGTLTVSATQADSAGNTSTAATTSITLDNQAPNALTITTPIEGDGKVNASEDNDVLVQGSGAESGATVTVNVGGVSTTTTADSSGNWSLSGNELDISALNNGTLTVSATQADSAGNTSTAATTSITLDNQAPNALTITTPIEGDGKVNASEDNDVLVQGGGAESGATVTVSIDGVTTTTTADSSGNWTLSGNELDLSALNNGTLTVSATQVDNAGNTSTAATTSITLDNQAPNALTITTPIEGDGKVNASEDNDVLVQGSGAESGATVTVNVGGVSTTTTADSSGNWSLSGNELDISALNNGTLTVSATQADSVGNTSTAATTSITLDNQAPNALTITTPIEGDGKVNAIEDNDVLVQGGGAESGATVTVSIDGVTTTTTADSSGNWTLSGNELDISALNNGTLTVSATQVDSAGNTSTAATTSITLDNQAPNALTITTPIEGDGKVNASEDNDVLVQGGGAESGATITVSIDGVTTTTTADSSGNWTLSGNELDISALNNGTLTVSATQVDSAGNTSTAATTSITLDNQAPNALTITTPIEGDGKVNASEDNDVLVQGGGAESGATVTVSIDGVTTTTTADTSGNWSLSGNELDISALNNGTLTVSATQVDSAGNTSTAATTSITLDNQAPNALTITTPIEGDGKVNANEDNDVLVQGGGAESGATITVSIDGVTKTTTADTSGNWSLSGNELDISALNNGTLTVSATQADSAGNTSTAATTSITLDNQAPNALTITTPIEGDGKVNASEDNDVLVQGGGAESGATVTVNIGGVTKTTTADTSGNWTLSGNELDISALNNGTLTVSATQADSAGNTSTAATTSITLDNQAPNALTITTPIEGDGKVNASEDNDVLVQGGGAESGATITVSIDGVTTTTTADSSGNWTLSGNELDISALNNGTLTVSATQVDSAGNTSTAATTTISLDNQAPNALTITTPIEGDGKVNASEDSDVLVQGGGAESGATVTVNIGGVIKTTTADTSGNWSLSGNELDISALNNGTLTVSATQADSAGNTSTAATTSITLDNQAPNALTITTPIEGDGKVNASEDNDVLVQGGGAESGATVTVNVGGVSTTTTADSSGNWSLSGNELDISALNNGTLTVSATQADTAGNTSTAATTSITLDNQAPNALTITTPIEGDGKVNASEDNDVLVQGGGAESGATVTVNVGGVSTTTTADSSGNWSLSGNELDISALNNGTLTVSAIQADSAGNTSTAATTSITLDNQAPNALTITMPIEGDGKVNASEDNDVLVQGGGAESGATVTVNIGGVTKTTTADTSGNWTLSGNELDISALNNGTLTVSATQADSAGNTSTAATTTIVLDNQTPSTLVINTPIEGDGIVNKDEDSDVEITGSGAESGATVSVDIAGVSQNVVANASGNWTLSGSELDISSLNNGTLTVSATQTDSAGNLSDLATKVITLDNVDPTGHSAAITQTEINRSNEAALSFTLSSLEGSGSFTYQITDGSNIVSSSAATTISAVTAEITDVDVTNLNEGTLTLSVAVSDSAGNEADDVTTSVIKRYNIKPVLSGSPITSIDEDAEYSFTPTLTDPDTADTQTFSITNKPNWATFDTATGLLSGTPTDQDVGTTTNVSIQVSDGTEDSDPLTFNIEVKNTNDAPIGEHFGFSLDEGALLTKVAADGVLSTATDDDTDSDDTLTAVKVTEPTSGTLTFNSDGSFSYQHDGSETTTDSFTYQVVDTAGEKSAIQTVSFTITSIEDAPVVVNDSATTDEDTPITFNVVANDSDAENNMVVSSAAVVDAATKGQVSIANGVVTYTPSSNVSGTDTFTYTVKDSTGLTSEKATVTVVITPVNDAPVASNFNEMVDEDTPTSALTVRSTATDVEDTVPTGDISLIAQPVKGSVSINQNDGTLIYTPAANENGQDTFTYTIADSDGLVSNTATVTVN
ncbi:Ig-like domain-containing protein, partial [Pseudoalteromonas neustonica]